MIISYFNDTDTAYIQFTEDTVAETRDLAEDGAIEIQIGFLFNFETP